VRAGRLRDAGRAEQAAEDYAAAVRLAREQGARMFEVRALTDWARLEGSPDSVRAELRACIEDVAAGGSSRSLDKARKVDAT